MDVCMVPAAVLAMVICDWVGLEGTAGRLPPRGIGRKGSIPERISSARLQLSDIYTCYEETCRSYRLVLHGDDAVADNRQLLR